MEPRERLELIHTWYRGMVSPRTGRFVYLYDPERDLVVDEGSAIRDLASAWDAAVLERFLGRVDLRPVVRATLAHHERGLIRRGDALLPDGRALGEPPCIAHSAFLILAHLADDPARGAPTVAGLAQGLLDQQRADGSLKVWFGDAPDTGIEFYPGEALLALAEAHAATRDPRYLDAVARGFAWFRGRRPADPHLAVFYVNWQSQYAAALFRATGRADVAEHLFALHDAILAGGFYDRIVRMPAAQASVEVACALEGIAEAASVAHAAGPPARASRYREAARTALAWLGEAQRAPHATPRERGGFGHSLRDRTQRIDVTGHVVNGLLKAVRYGLVGAPAPV